MFYQTQNIVNNTVQNLIYQEESNFIIKTQMKHFMLASEPLLRADVTRIWTFFLFCFTNLPLKKTHGCQIEEQIQLSEISSHAVPLEKKVINNRKDQRQDETTRQCNSLALTMKVSPSFCLPLTYFQKEIKKRQDGN